MSLPETFYKYTDPIFPNIVKWCAMRQIHPESLKRFSITQYTDHGTVPPYLIARAYCKDQFVVHRLDVKDQADLELILIYQSLDLDEVTVSLREGRYLFADRYRKPIPEVDSNA